MNFWNICEYVHLAHCWSKHIRLNSQSPVTSAEQTAARFGKIKILETKAFECSLCTEMENYRIKMCKCKGKKMRKNKNFFSFFFSFSNFPTFFPLLAWTNTSSNNPWFFLLLTGQDHTALKYIAVHSNPHPSSPNHKGMCSVMISQYLFLFFIYGEIAVINRDNAKYKNYLMLISMLSWKMHFTTHWMRNTDPVSDTPTPATTVMCEAWRRYAQQKCIFCHLWQSVKLTLRRHAMGKKMSSRSRRQSAFPNFFE